MNKICIYCKIIIITLQTLSPIPLSTNTIILV